MTLDVKRLARAVHRAGVADWDEATEYAEGIAAEYDRLTPARDAEPAGLGWDRIFSAFVRASGGPVTASLNQIKAEYAVLEARDVRPPPAADAPGQSPQSHGEA